MNPASVAVARSAAASGAGITITVEGLIWLGLLLAGASVRLVALDGFPFTTDEAARALDAARVADGEIPGTWRGDLAAAATSYLFRIFGEEDFVARVVPAAAGAALIGVLWFVRPYLGSLAALVAAGLVAISPLFVLFSRSAAEYSTGCLLAAVIIVSLFAYVERPRTGPAFVFVVALALAPLTDAPGIVAALAVLLFLVVEAIVLRNSDVRAAIRSFCTSPLQWMSALVVVAAAVQLGVTHFGTTLSADLPGVRLWTDMFDLPRDSRPSEYHSALLFAYDWPIFLLGTAGFFLLAARLAFQRGAAVSPFERLLLFWTLVGSFTLALTTRREAGQLLIVLLPLALLAGRLVEQVAGRLDWSEAGKWWPMGAVAAAPLAMAALLMTEWSSGNADEVERIVLVAALVSSPLLIAATLLFSRSGGAAAAAIVVVLVALPFMVHSSLALSFTEGAEPSVDARLSSRVDGLRETLVTLAGERGGTIVADGELQRELGWSLRDAPITFGGAAEGASVVLAGPEAAPPGFAGREEVWRVAEGWYPDEVPTPRPLWRWFLYRKPYGDVEALDVRIYVRTV